MMLLLAAVCSVAETVDDTHTWDDGLVGDWGDLHSDAALSNPGDHLEVQFEDAYSVPEYERCLAWTPIDHSVLITNLSFVFMADPRVPSELALYLHSRHSDITWQKQLVLSDPEFWQAFDVPVDLNAGWSRGPQTSYEKFQNDVLDIDWVGVFVVRSAGTEEMNYGIDDFRVQGLRLTDIVDDPADGNTNGIPDAWEDRHGLLGADPNGDADDDGMSNYAEWRAGTDPTNDLSRFVINAESRMQEPVDVGVAVKWDSIRYRSYSVWKSTNLFEDFTRHEQNIFCTPPQNEFLDTTATNSGPYFYRVTVED
jgi:hypothetical protein